ncbi:MAG TPA: hypothetical protein VFY42_04845 [Gemmatimonadales bacterium]|nr:hypothetical protein [Gemmatimonadales bacterium]
MYLVELKPGKEELYRTGDDLALAIRDGDVDSRSRIYHRATAKWISITLHPQYKAIVSAQVNETTARPARKVWGLLPSSLTSGVASEVPSTETEPGSGAVRRRWKRPTGFGLAGVLLILGMQLAHSGPRPPWAGRGKAVVIGRQQEQTSARVPAGRDESELEGSGDSDEAELITYANTTSVWPETVARSVEPIPTPAVEIPASPALPRAPKLRSKSLRAALTSRTSSKALKANSVQAILSRYDAASDEVRTRLESGMRVARLNRLFAPARLAPGGGVTDTRMSLAGAANFIRVYRQQQAGIDKAYQDTVALLARQHKWTPKELRQWQSRPQRREAPELELLSGSLLAGIDSILGVLDAEAGAYKLRGSAIAFEDPSATQAYGALRRRIKEQIDAAVSAGGATSFGPTGFLLQAIGTSTLPRET